MFRIFQAHYNSQIKSNALLDVRISYSNMDFPLKFQEGVPAELDGVDHR